MFLLRNIRNHYNHTIYACYLGYITQAIINNFAPLLFMTFAADYALSLDQITLITTVNFLVQLTVDLLSAKFLDRLGYRGSVATAHLFCTAGLVGMAFLPSVMNPYVGLLLSVVCYAIGGGIIEVAISPIVESCPTEKKEAAMSLLHSFYCWGHVFLVVVSTVFFALFGIENWRVLACIWALIPLLNAVYFCFVPLFPIVGSHTEPVSLSGLLKKQTFWVLFVLMICAGASEQGMSQWASSFAESALGVSKAVGDLAGPCAFAVFMGTARALYGKFEAKIPLRLFMSASAVLCVGCYLTAALVDLPFFGLIGCAVCGFSVGIFWPGTFSLAAQRIRGGGTAMYALLALAGDVGCAGGPTVVGFIADACGGDLKTGLLAAILFPILMFSGIRLLHSDKMQVEDSDIL